MSRCFKKCNIFKLFNPKFYKNKKSLTIVQLEHTPQNTKIERKNIKIEEEIINFNIEDYKHKKLMEGTYSMLFCINKNNKKYTCKKINKKNVNRCLDELTNIQILKGSRLPNFHDFRSSQDHFYLLYDFIPGNDLYTVLDHHESKIKRNFKLIATIIYEITLGLKELFLQNKIHLDLKPENIIISSLKPVKLTLIDLEFCKNINVIKRISYSGTLGWSSPEVILYNTFYYNTDIWSLGLILYTLFTGKMLFVANTKQEYINALMTYTNLKDIANLNIKNTTKNGYNLLYNMIHPKHIFRYSIDEVLQSDFLKLVDK